jgi:hypothetical protein
MKRAMPPASYLRAPRRKAIRRHSEIRADHDLDVNVKAEKEIEVVLQHLEYQNSILMAMVQKLGVSFDDTSR